MDLIQEDRILDLCDTLPEINLEIYNADRGIAKDVFLEVKLPDGISFVDQEIKFSYPKGSPFRILPPPQKLTLIHSDGILRIWIQTSNYLV